MPLVSSNINIQERNQLRENINFKEIKNNLNFFRKPYRQKELAALLDQNPPTQILDLYKEIAKKTIEEGKNVLSFFNNFLIEIAKIEKNIYFENPDELDTFRSESLGFANLVIDDYIQIYADKLSGLDKIQQDELTDLNKLCEEIIHAAWEDSSGLAPIHQSNLFHFARYFIFYQITFTLKTEPSADKQNTLERFCSIFNASQPSNEKVNEFAKAYLKFCLGFWPFLSKGNQDKATDFSRALLDHLIIEASPFQEYRQSLLKLGELVIRRRIRDQGFEFPEIAGNLGRLEAKFQQGEDWHLFSMRHYKVAFEKTIPLTDTNAKHARQRAILNSIDKHFKDTNSADIKTLFRYCQRLHWQTMIDYYTGEAKELAETKEKLEFLNIFRTQAALAEHMGLIEKLEGFKPKAKGFTWSECETLAYKGYLDAIETIYQYIMRSPLIRSKQEITCTSLEKRQYAYRNLLALASSSSAMLPTLQRWFQKKSAELARVLDSQLIDPSQSMQARGVLLGVYQALTKVLIASKIKPFDEIASFYSGIRDIWQESQDNRKAVCIILKNILIDSKVKVDQKIKESLQTTFKSKNISEITQHFQTMESTKGKSPSPLSDGPEPPDSPPLSPFSFMPSAPPPPSEAIDTPTSISDSQNPDYKGEPKRPFQDQHVRGLNSAGKEEPERFYIELS